MFIEIVITFSRQNAFSSQVKTSDVGESKTIGDRFCRERDVLFLAVTNMFNNFVSDK